MTKKTIEPKNGIGMIAICEIHTKKNNSIWEDFKKLIETVSPNNKLIIGRGAGVSLLHHRIVDYFRQNIIITRQNKP